MTGEGKTTINRFFDGWSSRHMAFGIVNTSSWKSISSPNFRAKEGVTYGKNRWMRQKILRPFCPAMEFTACFQLKKKRNFDELQRVVPNSVHTAFLNEIVSRFLFVKQYCKRDRAVTTRFHLRRPHWHQFCSWTIQATVHETRRLKMSGLKFLLTGIVWDSIISFVLDISN